MGSDRRLGLSRVRGVGPLRPVIPPWEWSTQIATSDRGRSSDRPFRRGSLPTPRRMRRVAGTRSSRPCRGIRRRGRRDGQVGRSPHGARSGCPSRHSVSRPSPLMEDQWPNGRREEIADASASGPFSVRPLTDLARAICRRSAEGLPPGGRRRLADTTKRRRREGRRRFEEEPSAREEEGARTTVESIFDVTDRCAV